MCVNLCIFLSTALIVSHKLWGIRFLLSSRSKCLLIHLLNSYETMFYLKCAIQRRAEEKEEQSGNQCPALSAVSKIMAYAWHVDGDDGIKAETLCTLPGCFNETSS